jgi:Xaa-Pro aminopeptidase
MKSPEQLLDGFEPSFEFVPVDPLPHTEFEERLRRIRREAVLAEHDALIFHTDIIGWYHTSNPYLRYMCDWMREGALIVPSDQDKQPTLLSFYSDSVLLPPPGEPTWVDDIRQVAPWGRHFFDRPGVTTGKLVEGTVGVLDELGISRGSLGLVGDSASSGYWAGLADALPSARLQNETRLVYAMQRVRSTGEQALIRAAAQLIDIGLQAAWHVTRPGVTDYEIYAAFTYAQMARGGETGDGYQIGINQYGTHISKPYGHVVRSGDLINLYASTVSYRGYRAQSARMISVGGMTSHQQEVVDMCADAVERATAAVKPGVLVRDVSNAGFEAYVERGYLDSVEARAMPWNWEANADGTPRIVPIQRVPDKDWENQGRDLRHVYPATIGPNDPSLGHSISPIGVAEYGILSTNYDRLEPGMMFVVHAQWLEPLKAGCNIGNALLVTEDGVENLSCHTPVEPWVIEVSE